MDNSMFHWITVITLQPLRIQMDDKNQKMINMITQQMDMIFNSNIENSATIFQNWPLG